MSHRSSRVSSFQFIHRLHHQPGARPHTTMNLLAPRASTAPYGLTVALLLLTGCAGVTDRVILLPQADGSTSALEVSAGAQHLRLDKPYAAVELKGKTLQVAPADAASVQKTYGALLAMQPAKPRSFVLQFEPNTNRLSASADAVLTEVRSALAALPAGDMVITGHTDRVGTLEANDRLSLTRAEAVRDILVAAGVDRALITVVGRGEREPAVPTEDEVAEARNRRVEIRIR